VLSALLVVQRLMLTPSVTHVPTHSSANANL
jgi:hypothetical protein